MSRQSLAAVRALSGLAQGAALYLLYEAAASRAWPASNDQVFAPLVLTTSLVPVLLVAGLGSLRLRTLAVWITAATLIVAALGVYDIFHAPETGLFGPGRGQARMPSFALELASACGLFIANALVVSGEADRAFVAAYGRYFDVAWKQAVQVALTAVFVGVLWGLLALGAALFRLIGIAAFEQLLKTPWFALPVTSLAVALALHVTDIQAGLVRGVRTLALTLLSWLLPLTTVIAAGFVLTLPFTGLDPLWSTHLATPLLLITATALVVLVNAAYQEGAGRAHPVAAVLRGTGVVAAVALTPLVALAAYAVLLRVRQHGWTPERIVATAAVVVAACYAAGYGVAAMSGRPWLHGVERTNVAASFTVLAVLLALLSPLADPVRIAVADQVARLEAGRTPVEEFDFAFLRFNGGRYGRAELERLRNKSDGPDAAPIAREALRALTATSAYKVPPATPGGPTPQERAANIAVAYPNGQPLPVTFVRQDWNAAPDKTRHWSCLTGFSKCDAVLVDVDGDGAAEILLAPARPHPGVLVYKEIAGTWSILGRMQNAGCPGAWDAVLAGRFDLAAQTFREIRVAGASLQLALENPGCGAPR